MLIIVYFRIVNYEVLASRFLVLHLMNDKLRLELLSPGLWLDTEKNTQGGKQRGTETKQTGTDRG